MHVRTDAADAVFSSTVTAGFSASHLHRVLLLMLRMMMVVMVVMLMMLMIVLMMVV